MRKRFKPDYRLLFVGLSLIATVAFAADGSNGTDVSIRGQRLSIESLKRFRLKTIHPDKALLTGQNKKGLDRDSLRTQFSLPELDSVPYWTDQFVAPGYDANGNAQSVWTYSMIGSAPESGQTTFIKAPIVPLIVEGLDQQGNVYKDPDTGTPIRQTVPPAILKGLLQSPFFEPSSYTSGTGQYLDQVMRAQFWDRVHGGHKNDSWDNGWHNLLVPSVKTPRVVHIPFGKLYYILNSDNSCCLLVAIDVNTFISLLYPQAYPIDASTPVGAAELSGDITTKDISTFLGNDVYLYDGDISNCCEGAFHGYDYEPGTPRNGNRPRLYVLNYSPWMTMGILFNNYGDVGAMSHEMAELFVDPFINNVTPWWQSSDPAYGFPRCMDIMEPGDVIENFVSVPQIYTTLTHGRTYHVVNVAMLSWFAFDSPSHAHLGAYSFPDEYTLTPLSPPGLLPNCTNAP